MTTTASAPERYVDLTQSQLLFWAGQQLNPDSPLYNMALSFDLKGTIDPVCFQSAFQLLVDKTDAMRTVFEVVDGVPQQGVLNALSYTVENLDFSTTADPKQHYQQWAKERSQQSFDLSKITFDCVLVKLSDQRFIWFLNQHHLTTDAWSVSVLYKAVAKFYRNSLEGVADNTPSLPSFFNYVDFEKVVRADASKASMHQYWQKKAAELPPSPRLYGFTGNTSTSASKRIVLDLGAERSTRLRTLMQEKDFRAWTQHLSLFNFFSTALFAYIYRSSGQKNLSIGTPAHNRPTADFKETPGVFINVLPMLAAVAETDSFLDLFQKVRGETFEFLRYAEPGAGNPKLSRGFNVILNYIHATFSDYNDIPMQSEWVHPGHCDPMHHLRLQVHDFDNSGTIQLYFDLNEEVFDAKQQAVIPFHFLKLLDAFIEDPSQQIGQIALLSEGELQGLLAANKPQEKTIAAQNIVDLFEQQARTTPLSVALSFKETTLNYIDLNAKANQLARFLQQKGIEKNSRVGLYFKRSTDLIISILAVLKAGATYLLIESACPEERLKHLLKDANASLVLSQKELLAQISDLSIPAISLSESEAEIAAFDRANLGLKIATTDLTYLMYTSGSTGLPKGVMIPHQALANYITWAKTTYQVDTNAIFALFTMIGFDLTVTSIFVPIISGGTIRIYEESGTGPDLALFDVVKENVVNHIKLTPSHLELLQDMDVSNASIKTMIVGGEDFKTNLAFNIQSAFGKDLKIYNEYGPTEATVGCIMHQFDLQQRNSNSVPIGKTIANARAYILDDFGNPVPRGVIGELHIAGLGLAQGYSNQPDLTQEKFITDPFYTDQKMYKTGDLARENEWGQLEFLGRKDHQVKIGGIRVELGEIEAALMKHPDIQSTVVDLQVKKPVNSQTDIDYCTECGLPSNYPSVSFNEAGVCHLCQGFVSYKKKVTQYFKTKEDLKELFYKRALKGDGNYDCIMLLSGGKDSTYALGQLIEMGLKVLAFTLDNGYISQQALDNVDRVVKELGVDHIVATTPAMNAIFVDSLERHCNVCNGCFKTIYSLSMKTALEKGIPYIVTGLSRGQFFETRLTEELFWNDEVDIDKIDDIILNTRKAYHRVDDAVKQLLDVSMFEDDSVFEKVQFVDFYRFTDVSLDEMLEYLDKRLPWERPTDTGRSTNCLINQVGIYVHKKEKGYNNYAFPYSWDVRVGHKDRDAALEEINEAVDEAEVERIMEEIGYTESEQANRSQSLNAYFTAASNLTSSDLRTFLAKFLPAYLIPSHFISLETLPLTSNGKVDRKALRSLNVRNREESQAYIAPSNQFEEILAGIWSEVLKVSKIGIHEKFLDIGGTSLLAIRINARIREAFDLELPVSQIFESATIANLATHIKNTLMALLSEMDQ